MKHPQTEEIFQQTRKVMVSFKRYLDYLFSRDNAEDEIRQLVERIAANLSPWTLDLIRQRQENGGKIDIERLPTIVVPEPDDRARFLLGQIIHDLPQNRDWLDPNLEKLAKEVAINV